MAAFRIPADGNVGLSDLSKLAQVVPDPCAFPTIPPLPPPEKGWRGAGIPPNQWAAMANFFTQLSPAERRNWAAIVQLIPALNGATNILNKRGEIDVNNIFVNNTATINNLSVTDLRISYINGFQFTVNLTLSTININGLVIYAKPNVSATAVSGQTVNGTTGSFTVTGFVNTSEGGGTLTGVVTAYNPRGYYIASGDPIWLSFDGTGLTWNVVGAGKGSSSTSTGSQEGGPTITVGGQTVYVKPDLTATAISGANVAGATGAFSINTFVNTSPQGGTLTGVTSATNPRAHSFQTGDKLYLGYNFTILTWEVIDYQRAEVKLHFTCADYVGVLSGDAVSHTFTQQPEGTAPTSSFTAGGTNNSELTFSIAGTYMVDVGVKTQYAFGTTGMRAVQYNLQQFRSSSWNTLLPSMTDSMTSPFSASPSSIYSNVSRSYAVTMAAGDKLRVIGTNIAGAVAIEAINVSLGVEK